MPPTIFQLLEALPAHFAGVAPSAAAVLQAQQAAHKLVVLARSHFEAGLGVDCSRLER